jgi:small subunit ribosomal protein S2
MYYVNHRWLGGLLTNWTTAQKSIERMKELDRLADDEQYAGRSKKEVSRLERERKHLTQNLAGLKEISGLPDLLFVVDSRKEEIAVAEANRLNIPVVAIVDTNCDPSPVNYVIPGNDDALRAIKLFASKVADTILEATNLATEGEGEVEAPAVEGPEGEFAVVTEDGMIVTEKGVVNPDNAAAQRQL